ncbi:MAG: peptide chain release factor N(5)-glutamine methyltransferase [Planctomycetes bacterium]|nr:peptide chain release factor N(5)-glutamine methyltransferase [Planctomycetota bacterium]
MTLGSMRVHAQTIAELLAWGERVLRQHRLPTPRLDAELLLAAHLGVERSELHPRASAEVAPGQEERFLAAIADRARGVPVAYLTGEREFYGHVFRVTPAVLVPRPETELLVEWACERLRARAQARPAPRIADVGTGSGCIAVALALELAAELPALELTATDLSAAAMEIARANAERLGAAARIRFVEGDLLAPLSGRYDLIISNPPYVAADDPGLHPHVAAFEPAIALRDVHEGDGLGFYRRFLRDAPRCLAPEGALLLEVGDTQIGAVSELFRKGGYGVESRRDLAGIERALLADRRTAAK